MTPEQEQEVISYIKELLETICQKDKKLAKESIDELTDTIYNSVKHQKDNPSKKEIRQMLIKIQEMCNDEQLTEQEKD